jgi:hypothetical protein
MKPLAFTENEPGRDSNDPEARSNDAKILFAVVDCNEEEAGEDVTVMRSVEERKTHGAALHR